MPVRLTPHGSLLITYDSKSKTWVSIGGLSLCILSEYIDIEPGVTLKHVFQIVDRDAEVKRFLAEYCGCDIDTLHTKPLSGRDEILLPTRMECVDSEKGIYRCIEHATADTVAIAPISWISSDRIGDRQFRVGFMLQARSLNNWESAANLGQYKDTSFATLCDLPLQVDTRLDVAECDKDKMPTDGTDLIVFQAHIRYTLFDVLTTIYKFFGNPFFDPRDQREVDEDEGIFLT